MHERFHGILVAHPGRQHSHQTALALQEAGLLAGYWTGVPCLESHASWVPTAIRDSLCHHGTVPLRPELVRWIPVAPLLRKGAESILNHRTAKIFEYLGYDLFDRLVARAVERYRPSAVVAYENSALHTFRTARRLGIVTVLDAASIHHEAQDRLHDVVESRRLHVRINKRKDAEIRLADHILTVSEFARSTYLDAGVPSQKVQSLMLGADISFFRPRQELRTDKDFTFIFVGSIIMRKGIDTLLEAFEKIRMRCGEVSLRFVGGNGEALPLLKENLSETITYAGPLSQVRLIEEYQHADCFILPSRNDSYGMVVAEALACGLPVIVSDMVGAKDIVREGENGWVVPVNDVSALAERMAWCVDHRAQLAGMGQAARESALNADWPAYHERLVRFIKSRVLRQT